MAVNLHDIFEHFCESTDGKIRWGENRRARTRLVLDFFHEYMKARGFGDATAEYMEIDAIWRDPHLDYIALALEHENSHDMRELIEQEMRHLVDLKAEAKVIIAYPHTGEEKSTLEKITRLIQQGANMTSDLLGEAYLIVFGFNTWHNKKPAIQWKGYLLNRTGRIDGERERVVFQREKSRK